MTITYGPDDVTAEVDSITQTPVYDESGNVLLYTLVTIKSMVVDNG